MAIKDHRAQKVTPRVTLKGGTPRPARGQNPLSNSSPLPRPSQADKSDADPYVTPTGKRGAERVTNLDRRLGTLDKTTADRR